MFYFYFLIFNVYLVYEFIINIYIAVTHAALDDHFVDVVKRFMVGNTDTMPIWQAIEWRPDNFQM